MRAEIIFKDYTIDVVIHPSCATESDFLVNITTGVGPQGYTPKRGIDYWTETDKEEIVVEATPERGVDYWTAADQQAIAAEAQSTAEAAAEATTAEILNDPEYKASIKGDKGDTGDPGYTPKRGIDYWTDEDQAIILQQATPVRGRDYWNAADKAEIIAEATPTKGVDYWTIEEKSEIISEAAPVRGVDYWTVEDRTAVIAEAKGDKGDKGDPGYTPVRGVDYWTDADQQIVSTQAEEAAEATAATMLSDPEYKASIKGNKGDPGYTPVKGIDYFDGQDGVSPTITVTDITGGHRVTITDADGAHSFDVMNGEDGAGAVQDVQVNGVSVLNDGVANVPSADANTYGVVRTGAVTVSGTTPTINALPGIRYVCGEVTTLDIVLPASGIVDVVFESGSMPTTLTVTPPTGVTMKWANGFDPASLEADTVYEINIADGCLGVAGTW